MKRNASRRAIMVRSRRYHDNHPQTRKSERLPSWDLSHTQMLLQQSNEQYHFCRNADFSSLGAHGFWEFALWCHYFVVLSVVAAFLRGSTLDLVPTKQGTPLAVSAYEIFQV